MHASMAPPCSTARASMLKVCWSQVLVAANEICQKLENGIFAGTLTPSMFDAAEARPALQFVRKD